MWGRQVYRWSDLDFEANLREGIAVDWPIRYADLAPWYDYVEDFIGITGEALALPHLPDSKFLPPMELNCVESVVKDAIAKHFGPERVLTLGAPQSLLGTIAAAQPAITAVHANEVASRDRTSAV
jgi:choline dehydrogenase-like flavoprotein